MNLLRVGCYRISEWFRLEGNLKPLQSHPCHGQGQFLLVPGSSKPHPAWPRTLTGIQGQPLLLWAACHRDYPVEHLDRLHPLWLSLSVDSSRVWAAELCSVPSGWDRAGALKLYNCSSRMLPLVFMKNFLQSDHTETLEGCWLPSLDGVGLSHLRRQWVCSTAELVSALDLHFWKFLLNLVLFEMISLWDCYVLLWTSRNASSLGTDRGESFPSLACVEGS